MIKKTILILWLSLSCGVLCAQHATIVEPLPGERWWGGAVGLGEHMPYAESRRFDLASQNDNNQVVPLLLSNRGRYLWSDKPFAFAVTDEGIAVDSEFEIPALETAGTTLRQAYLEASRLHFPPDGTLPDTLFFTVPQYNTWIELMYDQNQADILEYAQNILDNGFPPGVLMIDDNWQRYYGNFDFRAEKFPDPEGMIDRLHAMGFRVMVWVCPFVSADSPEYRTLRDRGYLIRDRSGRPAIFNWWNGQSACYDLTHPEAAAHFVSVLRETQAKYGVDGFKFDAGDNNFYARQDLASHDPQAISVDHTLAWAKIGLQFPFNEYRAGWQMGGRPLVQRLGDKDYSWDAVQSLIPQMTAAGLLGYAYTCPDMIGGGQYRSFLEMDQSRIDQSLIVRSAQVHALMPMMQFSVAPWRILNAGNLEIVRAAAKLHQTMGPYILSCARESARTGEPIVRHMEYAFPGEGFADCNDQFMLGDKYLVAPVVTPESGRTVKLPAGHWRDDRGQTHRGGRTIAIEVPLDRLPCFEKIR